jgi:hypothetical protein
VVAVRGDSSVSHQSWTTPGMQCLSLPRSVLLSITFCHGRNTSGACGTRANPVSYLMRTGGSIPVGVKRQGREDDHLPSSNAEGRNSGAIRTPPHTFSRCNAQLQLFLLLYIENFFQTNKKTCYLYFILCHNFMSR